MVLSIGTDGDADYYLRHQAEYYTGGAEPQGRWYTPDGQFGLVNDAPIDNGLFKDLMAGVAPSGTVIGRAPKNPKLTRASSYDLTFSVPKSVSILWALADPETRARLEDAVHRSVRRTLETAQTHAAWLRRGRNGVDLHQTRCFGALFQHGDARPMANGDGTVASDMNLHLHAVIFNLAQDDRGEWYALDGRPLLDWKMALGATHHAELARLLESEFGCRLRSTGQNGAFEVAGVPAELIAQFSRRRALITESLKAYGLTSAEAPELAAAITRLSREAKPGPDGAEAPEARFERWAREVLSAGVQPAEVLACLNGQSLSEVERRTRDAEFAEALQHLPFVLTETQAVVERRDVHRHVAALCASHGRGADDAERIVDAVLDPTPLPADLLNWPEARFAAFIAQKIAAGRLVALPNLTDRVGLPRFTAPDLIEAERGLWRLVDAHADDRRHCVPFAAVEAFIARLRQGPAPSTEEQENGIRYLTTRPGLVVALEGAAGSGKSVTLKQVTALYRDVLGPSLGAHYRVIGCSAKWLTAKAMVTDADLADQDARAAAQWIADLRLGRETIDRYTVMLVDEAGQLGSRDLYALLKPFADAGARIILTGDRAQQRSVGAGPALDVVVSRIGSLRLERSQRMQPQADDILVHRDRISREEAILRCHGLSPEQRRMLVQGATVAVKAEVHARFGDPRYRLSAEEALIWADGLAPPDAIRRVTDLSADDAAALVRSREEQARDHARAWAADSNTVATPTQVYHTLHGQAWSTAEQRAALLTPDQAASLVSGEAAAVRAAVLTWADSPTSPCTEADLRCWLDGVGRRAATTGTDAPATDPERIAQAKAAARAWAQAAAPQPTAEDVLHWVYGLPWPAAFARIDGLSPAERAALVAAPGAAPTAAQRTAMATAEAWSRRPLETITAADVLVHVFGLTRPDAEHRAATLPPDQRQDLIARHHQAVRDNGQLWAAQAATDFSNGPSDPALTLRALHAYQAHGRLTWAWSHQDALMAAVDDWQRFTLDHPNATAVVLARSNADIRALNTLMRTRLRERGHLAAEEVVIATLARQRIGPQRLAIDLPVALGEQILFTRRDDQLGVVNGTIGRVTGLAPGSKPGHARLTVAIADSHGHERTILVDTASYADPKTGRSPLEHAYAVTSFSAQGMTRTAAFAQIDSGQTSNAAYVATSRARALTMLYASRQTEDLALASALPLRERQAATFSDRERLRHLAHHLARGQHQPSVLDAFDPAWRQRIRTARAEGVYQSLVPPVVAPMPPLSRPRFPPSVFCDWQPASASLQSPHRRVVPQGGSMPRDPIYPQAPFRGPRPTVDAARRAAERSLARREFEQINGGEVDFREILRAHGWAPVRTDTPHLNCFWTPGGGSARKLDAQNTISIIRKGGRWTWCLKADQSVGGRITDWGTQFGAWSMTGKGYWETWRLLRDHLPGAPALAGTPPLTEAQRRERDRLIQDAVERRTVERLATEADLQRQIHQTHARAQRHWRQLVTPAAMTTGNYLLSRGIALATQLRYAETIGFDRETGAVAFKHTAADGTLTGFERKRDGWDKFTTGPGGKALALFGTAAAPLRRIVITETGIDALSLVQLDGLPEDTLYLSTGGNANSRLDPAATTAGAHLPAEHLLALARRHPEAVIELATDRDHGGNRQAEGWQALLTGHPGGVVRRVPVSTNDWNNELRLPHPMLLSEARYRKDLRKAVPSLPPPPPSRPDLLPHWQAYEAARTDLPAVLAILAQGVGAWDTQANTLDRRAWSAQPMARALWSAIHEDIAADRPLSAAITAALAAHLPGWHAWQTQQAAFAGLEDRLVRAVAWDEAHNRVDHSWLARTGLRDDLLAIREAIQHRALALPAAIDAALAAGHPGRDRVPSPERTIALAALRTLQAGLPEPADLAVSPETVRLYPPFDALTALAAELSARSPSRPSPAAGTTPVEDRTPEDSRGDSAAFERERQPVIAETLAGDAFPDEPQDPDAEPAPEDALMDSTLAPAPPDLDSPEPSEPPSDGARSPAIDRGIRAAEARHRQRAVATGDGRSQPSSRPPTLGEEFGIDPSADRARPDALKQLGQWYQAHFAARHETDLAWVRIRPGSFSDEVVVEFRDGSRLRDNGADLLLNEKGTPQKAALMIEIAAAKGMTPLRLRGGWQFKLDLATACFEHGLQVLNPELRHHLEHLRARFPEREGLYRPVGRPQPVAPDKTAPDAPPAPIAAEIIATATELTAATGRAKRCVLAARLYRLVAIAEPTLTAWETSSPAAADSPTASQTAEIRAAVRDAIPWLSFPRVWDADPVAVKPSTAPDRTNLGAALAVLYRAADPEAVGLGPTEIEAVGSSDDRMALIAWLTLSAATTEVERHPATPLVTFSAATRAITYARTIAGWATDTDNPALARAAAEALEKVEPLAQAAARTMAGTPAVMAEADPQTLDHLRTYGVVGPVAAPSTGGEQRSPEFDMDL